MWSSACRCHRARSLGRRNTTGCGFAFSGIAVNLITGSAGALAERMKAEGEHSPADVLITTDAGRLYRAQQENQLAAVNSDVLTERVPATLRDPEGYWYGLSVRARVDVMIRPDDILHNDDSPRTARVVDRAFRGAHMLYTLELPGGVRVPCLAPSHHAHPIGGDIGIELEMDHLVTFAPVGQGWLERSRKTPPLHRVSDTEQQTPENPGLWDSAG